MIVTSIQGALQQYIQHQARLGHHLVSSIAFEFKLDVSWQQQTTLEPTLNKHCKITVVPRLRGDMLTSPTLDSGFVVHGSIRQRVGDPQRDGPLGIPKGNRLFPLGSTPKGGFWSIHHIFL
jgi:hypothetical protein